MTSRIIRSIAALTVGLVSSASAARAGASGMLESVNMLAAGAGSSLVVRTSEVAVLVATRAADSRTVTIDLVGIAGDRRHLIVTGRARMISHIAVNRIDSGASDTTTRIRVSLTAAYRHRVRTFGNLVYVDFRPVDELLPAPGAALPSIVAVDPDPVAPASILHTAPSAAYAASNGQTLRSANVDTGLLARWSALLEPVQRFLKPSTTGPLPPAPTEWMPLALKDGTTIYSHGEYSEVNDHLTLLLPFDDNAAPRVEAVSIPNHAIDRAATEELAESARAARYAASRGPSDFAAFSQRIREVVDSVPSQTDPRARVTLIEDVMRQLIQWPGAHRGYRAAEIGEAVNALGSILNQLRLEDGRHNVVLTFTAPTQPRFAPSRPRLVDLLDVAMRVVAFLTVPAERTAVLTATAESLHRHRGELPVDWVSEGERRVTAALAVERGAEDAYRQLSFDVVARAIRAAQDGDVGAIGTLRSDLMERDAELGRKRPDVVVSTMAMLQTQFDAAARLHLDRERRALEIRSLRQYAAEVASAVRRFRSLRPHLEQLQRLSTNRSKMREMREDIDFVNRTLAASSPAPHVADAHRLMVRAGQLAADATKETSDSGVSPARAASPRTRAAIEAMTTFERGSLELEAVLQSLPNR